MTVDSSWRDDDQAAADALGVLKLSPTGPDAALMLDYAAEAGDLICLELDRLDPIPDIEPGVPPPPLRGAHRDVTVTLWRRKDAPDGVVNAWSTDVIPVDISADPLAGVRARITPFKGGWGVG